MQRSWGRRLALSAALHAHPPPLGPHHVLGFHWPWLFCLSPDPVEPLFFLPHPEGVAAGRGPSVRSQWQSQGSPGAWALVICLHVSPSAGETHSCGRGPYCTPHPPEPPWGWGQPGNPRSSLITALETKPNQDGRGRERQAGAHGLCPAGRAPEGQAGTQGASVCGALSAHRGHQLGRDTAASCGSEGVLLHIAQMWAAGPLAAPLVGGWGRELAIWKDTLSAVGCPLTLSRLTLDT